MSVIICFHRRESKSDWYSDMSALYQIVRVFFSNDSLQNKHPHVIYEYSDTSTQGCAVTEGFGGVPGSSGGIGGGGYNNRQKRRSGSSPAAAVQDVKDFLKQNTKLEFQQLLNRSVNNFFSIFLFVGFSCFPR